MLSTGREVRLSTPLEDSEEERTAWWDVDPTAEQHFPSVLQTSTGGVVIAWWLGVWFGGAESTSLISGRGDS